MQLPREALSHLAQRLRLLAENVLLAAVSRYVYGIGEGHDWLLRIFVEGVELDKRSLRRKIEGGNQSMISW